MSIANETAPLPRHRKTLLLPFALVALIAGVLTGVSRAERPQLVLETGPGFVSSMAFSPDGKILASSGRDHSTTLWDAASGRELRTLDERTTSIYAVAFSPDGRILADGGGDKTIKLWDVSQARELSTLAGHSDEISSLAFASDQILASGSFDGTVKLWNVASGRLLRTLAVHDKPIDYPIYAIAFSPDGHILASGGQDQTIKLWDAVNGKVLQTLDGHTALSMAFSPNGRTLAVMNGDDHARLWDISSLPGTPRLLAELDQQGRESDSCYDALTGRLAFSPDGRTLLTGGCYLKLWDVGSARELLSLKNSALVTAVAFSPDGRLAAANGFQKTVHLWDPTGNHELQVLEDHRARICSLAVDPHGRALAARALDGMIKVWDVAGAGEHLITTRDKGNRYCSATFDPDGRILAGENGNSATLWDVSTGKELRTLKGHSGIQSVAFASGYTVASAGNNEITFWNAATGDELRTLRNPSGIDWVVFNSDASLISSHNYLWEIQANQIVLNSDFAPLPLDKTTRSSGPREFAFSPDGRTLASCDGLWDIPAKQLRPLTGCTSGRIVVFSSDGKIVAVVSGVAATIWDTATGRQLRTFLAHEYISAIAFSPDGRILATASEEGRVTLWEVSSGQELATLFLLDKGDWAVLDPAGRFDASPRGMQLMHWAIGMNTIALSQLKERYYEPGLLGKILGLNKEPLRGVTALNDVKLYPDVRAEAPAQGSTKLKLKLADLGGGIGRVQIFVNGTEFLADARGPKPALSVGDTSLAVDLAGAHLKPGEPNEIRVVAWNTEGYLSSRGFTVTWDPGGAKDRNPPEFYAIVAGVSEYSSPEIQLRFAARDAEAMAHALKLGASRLFGAEHVHITLLTSPVAPGGSGATKASLKQAFDAVVKARPGDVFMVYLAGHGVAIQGLYAYPTADARTLELSDPAVRLVSAVSDGELVEWINKVPALHKVMVLDTCAAGAIEGRLVEKRGVPGDQIRAIERLKDRTGFYVLMGSAADAASYEASQFGQGLLTYSVLKGMKGAALREGQFVDVANLFQEVTDDVPQLAKNIGGIQQPRVAMPGGESFDIGQLSPEDRAAIPLATAGPLLLRPLFINTQLHRDNLRLSEALQKRLRNQGYAADRGGSGQPAPVYVDQDDFPGAVSPSGDYTVDGNRVSVTIVLARDGREISHLSIEGKADDVNALAANMANEINRAILQ